MYPKNICTWSEIVDNHLHASAEIERVSGNQICQ